MEKPNKINKEALKEQKDYLESLNTKDGQEKFKEEAEEEREREAVWGKKHMEDEKKEKKTEENQEETLNKDEYDPVGEVAEGYVLNQMKKSEDWKRQKKEEEIKKAYEAVKEYWDEKDKEKNTEQKSEEGLKEKSKEEFLAEKNKQLEKELEERLKGALASDGTKSEEKAHDIKRNFYLEKLDYSVKYVGVLWWRKGRILDKDGKYVLDENGKKPVEFKPTFGHKGEMPIIKFLKGELEKENRDGKEKKSDGKEIIGDKAEKNSSDGSIKPKVEKEKTEEIKSDNAKDKSKEKKPENKESEKVFNIDKLFSDCMSGKEFFKKENLEKITIEKNAKEITEVIKSYGRELKWPDDLEEKIKKYDQEKPESSRFDKLKEKKDKWGTLAWFLDLLFKMNVTIIKF